MKEALLASMLVLGGLSVAAPGVAADDCQNLIVPNGFAGVYLCPGNRIEVRSGGTLLATGPTSGVGWYVTSGGAYVAADFTCFGDYCYITVAAFPVGVCQIVFSLPHGEVRPCLV